MDGRNVLILKMTKFGRYPLGVLGMVEEFYKRYLSGVGDIYRFFAPARVNLIGEHTDYNKGLALPVCVNRYMHLLLQKREDDKFFFASENFNEPPVCVSKSNLKKTNCWVDYPLGVIKILIDRGYNFGGMNLFYSSNIPCGCGLSSSAAIEVVSCLAISKVWGLNISKKEIALTSQKAENEFVEVKCGIMDQLAISLGKAGSALFIDCKNLDYKFVEAKIGKAHFIVCNTNIKRELSNSKYEERQKECLKALGILKELLPGIESISDVKIADFERIKNKLPEMLANRCEHIIYENERVEEMVCALEKSDVKKIGSLLNKSHSSLRELYEVSCRELDIMVESAKNLKGVYGARMTGAGFGGCAIALVEKNEVENFIDKMKQEYKKKTGYDAEFYVCNITGGAGEGVPK